MALARERRVPVLIAATAALALVACGCAAPAAHPSADKGVAAGPSTPTYAAVGFASSFPPPPPPRGAASATLIVHGMGCPLCANNVDKQLLKVPGVDAVNVDLGTGRVTVSFASGAPRPGDDRLAKAVANSGYTLVRIQTP
jgi:copper chaperone CopZ